MPSTRAAEGASPRPGRRCLGAWLALLLLPVGTTALAEGSRSLYPATYNAAGSRGVMDASNATTFAGVAAGNQFLYVYAQAGEYILLGSRNRSNGGDVLVYNPQSFGTKGTETIPGTANFSCSSQTGRGTIASRAQELAGPNSADSTATVTDGYAPCWYVAPSTGIYGVRFTGASSGGQANNASVATPQILTGNLTSAWDVSVRAGAASLADLNARVFTYAWTIYNNANGRQLYNDLYYVSLDGYRYRQSFRGLDPNRAGFYANASGFIDTNGSALYRDFRGADQSATAGPSGTAGVTPQRPQYPIFFSDVSPAGANAAEVNRVLSALAIPATPAAPLLTAPSFVGNLGGNTSTVSTGGAFTFNTVNTLTYEIVISRNGSDFDPANPLNRVLTGTALTGSHSVLWDGRDNSGTAFPAGNYDFRIVGRNGEIHFPMVDVEANVNGGPTLTKLNGSQDTTVYFDDRGYRTANNTLIGQLNGLLCGAGSAILPPVPSYSLLGVDSANADLGGTGNYYRSWGGSNDSNTDCSNSANEYFGTAKGLDLWALEKSAQFVQTVIIVPPTGGVDVTTQATVSSSVISGGTAYGSFVFSNAGDTQADGVSYSATLGNPAQPATCPAAVTFTVTPPGVTATYNPAPACSITFTGMPASLTAAQSLAFSFNYVVAPTNPGPIVLTTTIAATNETPGAPAPNTATAQTVVARPIIDVVKSSVPAPGSQVTVGATITYTLTVSVTNAPLSAVLSLTDTLDTGLTFGSVSSAGSFNCSGALTCTLPVGTATGSYAVTYTAVVNAAANGSVVNAVVPSGGGGQNPPTCSPCTVAHTLPPAISVVKSSNPASGVAVSAGQSITYTLTATVANGALTSPLVLTDTLSANQTFGSVTSAGSYSCSGAVQCTLPTGTAPGTYAVSYTATVNANATGAVGNSVVASGGSTTPPTCTTCTTTHPLNPAVSVVKSSNPASGTAVTTGQSITYTLTATVTNAALTSPLVLTDTLSANQTFGSVTSAGSYSCSGSVQCTLPTGTVPGTYAVSYTATVNANASGSVGNSVVATGGSTTPPSCTTCTTTHPLNSAVNVVKSSNPASGTAVSAGQTITYTLTATVTNAALSSPLVLTDTLSANQTFGSVTSAGSYSCSGAVQCTLPTGTLPGTYAVSYNATVNANATGAVGNSVTATGGSTTPPSCTTCTTTHPLNPAISVVKLSNPASGSTVAAGQTITYTVTATVSNAALSSPLLLTDTISANQTFGSVTSAGSYSCSGALQCTLPTGTVPGTYPLSYTTTVNANATGSVSNSIVASGGSTTPPACTSCSTSHPLQASVSLVKTLSSESGSIAGVAEAGESLTYTITLSNSGGANATGFGVTDALDPNVVFVSADNGGVAVGGDVTWAGLTVPAGGSLSLHVTVSVADPLPAGVSQVANLAYQTGTTPPSCSSTPLPPQCVLTPTAANVSVSKALTGEDGSQAGIAEPGELLTYTLSVSNSGGSAASNIGVSDRIDANTTFVSADNGGSFAAGIVSWTGLSIPAGGTQLLSVSVRVPNPIPVGVAQVANLAYLTGTPPPACPPAGPQCVVTVTAPSPRLQVSKRVNLSTVIAGGNVTYTITVTNVSSVTANNVSIDDALPAGISGFNWTCAGSNGAVCPALSGSGAIHQLVPQLQPGAVLTYSVIAQISAQASGGILNTVLVSPSVDTVCMPSGLPGPCDASAPLTVVGTTGDAVPVPALDRLAMLLMGMALAGFAWRRRHQRES